MTSKVTLEPLALQRLRASLTLEVVDMAVLFAT